MKDFEQNKKNAGKKRVHLGNCTENFPDRYQMSC